MCFLCRKVNDYTLTHLEEEIKKIKLEEVKIKALEIKNLISKFEILAKSSHTDGFELEILSNNIKNLKSIQYLLSRNI